MSTTPDTPETPANVQKLYKSRIPSVNYLFRNGKPAIFVNGRFSTAVPAEIEELDHEVALGHPTIYVDAAEATIDVSKTPYEAIREKIIAEYLAAQAAATDPGNDMGNYEAGKVNPASSMDVAAAALGGSGAQLVTLKQ
jgi:hypothetical protein